MYLVHVFPFGHKLHEAYKLPKHNILFANVGLAGSQKDHDPKDLMIGIRKTYDPKNDMSHKGPV